MKPSRKVLIPREVLTITRNRVHIFALCQCADYAHDIYVGAGEVHVASVTFAVGESVWCLVVSKP